MKKLIWFILPLMLLSSAFISNKNISSVNDDDIKIGWVSFNEAMDLNTEDPKMIFIDFYTDWCSWCKKMDDNVFANPSISNLISDKFHAVKFDAEEDVVINFKDKEYKLDVEGRRPAHELAKELATHNERLGYPTFVVLDENFEHLKTFQGYKTVDAMKQILEYYGDENIYKEMNWLQFIQGNQSAID